MFVLLQRTKLTNVRLCQKYFGKNYLNYPVVAQTDNARPFAALRRHFSLQSTIESIARTQTGIFKSLSESTPVAYSQDFLLTVHNTTGLPWWATIICTTVLLRSCVTVPLAIYQHYILAKLENIKMEMDDIAKELKHETSIAVKLYKWDERTAKIAFRRSIKKQWKGLIIRDNCHPFKTTLLFLFQIPLWISVSISLRNLVYMLPEQDALAQLTFTELSVGGFGWISNLCEVDSTFILPVIFGLTNLAIIEMQTLCKVTVPSKLQVYLTNFFRLLSIFMVPIAASVPSCLVLYWTTSSVHGLVQNLILISPKVKRTFRIPHTPSELERPYHHLVVGIKHRLKNLVNL